MKHGYNKRYCGKGRCLDCTQFHVSSTMIPLYQLVMKRRKKYLKLQKSFLIKSALHERHLYARIGIVLWYTEKEELNDLYYMSIRLGIEKRCEQQDIQVVNSYNNIESMKHEDLQGIIAVGSLV